MKTFIRFEETNEHEGETWSWWLQVDGNDKEIAKLTILLDQVEQDLGYELDYSVYLEDEEPEDVVDKLVEYADEGYGLSHNKVTGKFTCPDDLGEYADKLYKGGINDFFRKDD